ncbi:MAG: antibiotic biosynthesis monooxygenase [Phycisphaerales bacterium]|nr:MAG: antibiotic biosynthesis monooxygenase [Phycisphaerales bacterium]
MAEHPLTVIARVKAKPEKLEHVRQTLKNLIGPTREERGCIHYLLHESKDDPCSFLFVEIWKSQADLDDHLQKPYLQDLVAQAEELFGEPLDVTLWHEVAG